LRSEFTAKAIFFISNITRDVSREGQHLILAGTPVSAEDTTNPKTVRHIVQKMEDDITSIYPNFNDKTILWSRPMAWKLVESVVMNIQKLQACSLLAILLLVTA
jgi:hypothetical protein